MFKCDMSFTFIFFAILCTVLGQEKKITLYFSPEQVLAARPVSEICGNKYGVDPKDMRKILDWSFPDDQAHKHFVYCILFKLNYINEDGHINIEEASKIIPIDATQEEALRIYKKCNNVSLEDPIETMFVVCTCYHKYVDFVLKKPES